MPLCKVLVGGLSQFLLEIRIILLTPTIGPLTGIMFHLARLKIAIQATTQLTCMAKKLTPPSYPFTVRWRCHL